jgi:hypothetical protein
MKMALHGCATDMVVGYLTSTVHSPDKGMIR